MNVVRARTAGFCMGVGLALKKLDRVLEQYQGRRIVTLGPIIHNPQVLAKYAARGVLVVDDPQEVRAGDCVLIRAHGIPRQMQDLLTEQDALVVDATCPKVRKAQLAIAAATEERQAHLLLFGEADHPEVRGLVSYATNGAQVFGSLEELHRLQLDHGTCYVLASQTTQARHAFDAIEACLRRNFPDIPVLSTICDATYERQEEVLRIAGMVDAMIVVGGRASGNTRRLADLAAAHVPTIHVEIPEELDVSRLPPCARVGLTAGASTPACLIDAVQKMLESA